LNLVLIQMCNKIKHDLRKTKLYYKKIVEDHMVKTIN